MESIHILLVEDNMGEIMFTKDDFQEARIANEISTVNNGKKAIHFLEKKAKYKGQETPDLILFDVYLPRKNGHEVLCHIKKSDEPMQIPVIMLTSSSDDRVIIDSYKHYANCYTTKPIDVDNFLNTISKIENFGYSL